MRPNYYARSRENCGKSMIIIGSDHAGFFVKTILKNILEKEYALEVIDKGVFSEQVSDYPDTAVTVAKEIQNNNRALGILICATGIGMAITANKFKGIKAAVCHNKIAAIYSRKHNNANILCLGSRVNTIEEIKEILNIWLSTPFDGERHLRRIKKIESIENQFLNS